MDPKLAEIYGTNQQDEADLEKLAAAELAEGLADEDQLDTDGMTDEDLEAVAQEVLNASAEEGGEEEGDESQEKLAEADYLGRVMAHSYVNELRGIEKEAAKKKGPGMVASAKKGAKKIYRKAGKVVGKAAAKTEKAGRHITDPAARAAKAVGKSIAGGFRGAGGHEALQAAKKGAGKVGKFMMKHRGKAAIGGLTAAGAYGAKKLHEKHASAFETLAEQRALAMLEEAGIDPSELMETEVEKTSAAPYDILAERVEQAALEMLANAGVEVEDIDGDDEE